MVIGMNEIHTIIEEKDMALITWLSQEMKEGE